MQQKCHKENITMMIQTTNGKCGCDKTTTGYEKWMGASLKMTPTDKAIEEDMECKNGLSVQKAKISCSSTEQGLMKFEVEEGSCKCSDRTPGYENWMAAKAELPLGPNDIEPKCDNGVESMGKTTCQSTQDGLQLTVDQVPSCKCIIHETQKKK